MKIKRHSPAATGFSTGVQSIRKLRTAEQILNQGQTVTDVCRALEASAATNNQWQQEGG